MAACLACLSTVGGVPLFCRVKGDIVSLSYPLIGTLNTINIFCDNNGVQICSTFADCSKITWKVFHNRVTFILVSDYKNTGDRVFDHFLNMIFDAIILQHGVDDLLAHQSYENLKKMFQRSFPIIDTIMETFIEPADASLLTRSTELMVGIDNVFLKAHLEGFTSAVHSSHGCILVHGQVAIATDMWWNLSNMELLILPQLISSLGHCTTRDFAIYLPDTSPQVAKRLLTFSLVRGVEMCVICGPSPCLSEVNQKVKNFWELSSWSSLKSLQQPKFVNSFPTLNFCVQCLLLVNVALHKYLQVFGHLTTVSQASVSVECTPMKLRQLLHNFYEVVVGLFRQSSLSVHTQEDSASSMNFCKPGMKWVHHFRDVYMCTNAHKYYALQQDQYQLFVIYDSAIPVYALKSVSEETLRILVT